MPLSRKYCHSKKRKPVQHKRICKKYGLLRSKNSHVKSTNKSKRKSRKSSIFKL